MNCYPDTDEEEEDEQEKQARGDNEKSDEEELDEIAIERSRQALESTFIGQLSGHGTRRGGQHFANRSGSHKK